MLHKYKKMEDKQTIIDRWEKVGFLKGFEGEKKETLAYFYNNLANALIRQEEKRNKRSFKIIKQLCFVVARRLLEKPEIYVIIANDNLKKLSEHLLRTMIVSFDSWYVEQEDGTDKDLAYCNNFSNQFAEDYRLLTFMLEDEE